MEAANVSEEYKVVLFLIILSWLEYIKQANKEMSECHSYFTGQLLFSSLSLGWFQRDKAQD